MKKLAALLLLIALAVPATSHAVDAPIVSISRLSLAGGASYSWWESLGQQPVPEWGKEWSVGAYASYTLLSPLSDGSGPPPTALVYGAEYGLDNKLLQHRLGIRVVLFRGTK